MEAVDQLGASVLERKNQIILLSILALTVSAYAGAISPATDPRVQSIRETYSDAKASVREKLGIEDLRLPSLGTGSSFFEALKLSLNKRTITSGGKEWQIKLERKTKKTYKGKVRHAEKNNIPYFPIISHDILVTTGDYANPKIVFTSVSNNRFYWSTNDGMPKGSINLLHTVPADEAIYKKLNAIDNGDMVTISGYEVDRIDYGQRWWTDSGCNTFLVTGVS